MSVCKVPVISIPVCPKFEWVCKFRYKSKLRILSKLFQWELPCFIQRERERERQTDRQT